MSCLSKPQKKMHVVKHLAKNNKLYKDATYNCGTFKEERETEGRARTKFNIGIYVEHGWFYDGVCNCEVPGTIMRVNYLVRPYKKTLGVWYWCTRTIAADIKVALDSYSTSTGWVRKKFSNHHDYSRRSKIEQDLVGGFISWGYFATDVTFHFGGLDCWGDSYSTDHVHIECNKSIAN